MMELKFKELAIGARFRFAEMGGGGVFVWVKVSASDVVRWQGPLTPAKKNPILSLLDWPGEDGYEWAGVVTTDVPPVAKAPVEVAIPSAPKPVQAQTQSRPFRSTRDINTMCAYLVDKPGQGVYCVNSYGRRVRIDKIKRIGDKFVAHEPNGRGANGKWHTTRLEDVTVA